VVLKEALVLDGHGRHLKAARDGRDGRVGRRGLDRPDAGIQVVDRGRQRPAGDPQSGDDEDQDEEAANTS
jgi:hypothetical protein